LARGVTRGSRAAVFNRPCFDMTTNALGLLVRWLALCEKKHTPEGQRFALDYDQAILLAVQ
jgi:hypothetical protein